LVYPSYGGGGVPESFAALYYPSEQERNMAKLKITYLDISHIQDRPDSQRKKPEGVDALADSINRIGLIHPIVVDEELTLVAGGCRLAAFKKLAETDPKFQTIPTVQRKDLSAAERSVIELEENVKRSELPWRDEAIAIVRLHKMLRALHDNWLQENSAEYIGYSIAAFQRALRVGRALLEDNPKIKECQTLMAAYNILEREKARTEDNLMNEIFEELNEQVEENITDKEQAKVDADPLYIPQGKPIKVNTPATVAKAIVQTDFIQWAQHYNGPKFNLVHCDFPYGINHGKSDQGGAKGRWESYEDHPDVYFALIKAFLENRERFMLRSCHIMFWLSGRNSMHQITREMFTDLAPEIDVDEYPLIWHKSDNKGIIRQVDHTPRHVYETALLMTRGERKIIEPVADTYSAPTQKSQSMHISEKPVPVLRHFFRLFVDKFSEVLDPTAGSGTAMRAASLMGAKRVLGLELNPEYAEGAQKEYERTMALENLSKKGTE